MADLRSSAKADLGSSGQNLAAMSCSPAIQPQTALYGRFRLLRRAEPDPLLSFGFFHSCRPAKSDFCEAVVGDITIQTKKVRITFERER